jgi:biopolymer transport protein ExbB/TolQ
MANSDPYYICHALWGLFLFIIIEALYYSNTDKRVEKLATLSFIASLAGLLGTFLGLAGAFAQVDVTSLDPANVEEVRKTMSEMFSNMRLAMNTSITGMFVSLPALAYMYFLGEKTKEGN